MSSPLPYQKKDWGHGPGNQFFDNTPTIDFPVVHAISQYIVKSVSYQNTLQNKDWQGNTHQSFFRYENDNDLKRRIFAAHTS